MRRIVAILLLLTMVISMASCKSSPKENEESTQNETSQEINIEDLAEKVNVPDKIDVDFTKILKDNEDYEQVEGLMAFKENMLCTFNEKVSYPLDLKILKLNDVLYVDAENFVKMFNMDYQKSDENSAIITLDELKITIKANSDLINVNGTDYDFITILSYNDSLLISIEEFIKAMGYTIDFDSKSEIYYFYADEEEYSKKNMKNMKANIKLYEEVIYNYDDVECDQTGVGLYEKSKPEDRLVGIAYTTWNRLSYPWPSGGSWSFPLLGKYASDNEDVVRQHGIWLADAGVDFVFIDWSNNTDYYRGGSGGTRADFDMIEGATDVLFDVWAEIPNAPKICIFVGPGHAGPGSVANGNHQRKVNQVYKSYIKDEKNKEMYFHYEGKPLLICYGATPTQYGSDPEWTDDRFTIRWMTGFVGQQGSLFDKKTLRSERYWSWEEREAQTYTVKDGVVEAVTCSAATRAQGAPYIPESGRENGKTLKRQFQRAMDLGASIVLIVSWNEWTTGEQPSVEVSKDIEPSEAYGTYYYDLMREQIKKFKGKV